MDEFEVSTLEYNNRLRLMESTLPQCEGLPRSEWISKCVILHNPFGTPVARGICVSISSDLVVGSAGPLGDLHVAVQISRSLCESEVPDEWRFSVRAWSITHVFYNGASFHDHEQRDIYNKLQSTPPSVTLKAGSRPYNSVIRQPTPQPTRKSSSLLTTADINSVSSQICCKKNCVQPFPRQKIEVLRQRMYSSTQFQFRQHLKLDVHRQIHDDGDGNSVVTLEGMDICLTAWRIIMGVSKTTFYRYADLAKAGTRAGAHGNLGTTKPRQGTLQATATLRCLLDKAADHMPHKSKALMSGERVVSMSLPSSWKWVDSLSQLNEVNERYGLNQISSSNLSKIQRVSFLEYDAKRPGDNFA